MTALADISVINASGVPTGALALVMFEGDERKAPLCPFGPLVSDWGPIAVAYYACLLEIKGRGDIALLDSAVEVIIGADNEAANTIIEVLKTTEIGCTLVEQRLEALGD